MLYLRENLEQLCADNLLQPKMSKQIVMTSLRLPSQIRRISLQRLVNGSEGVLWSRPQQWKVDAAMIYLLVSITYSKLMPLSMYSMYLI